MVLENAALIHQSPLQLREWPKPEPRDNQIRVAIRCCGMCHTDLHTVEGELKTPQDSSYPGTPDCRNRRSARLKLHTSSAKARVGIPWLFRTDGTCPYCRDGKENLCDHAEFTGLNVDGGYAEYMVVDEDFAIASFHVRQSHAAPLLCAGVIGFRSFRLSGPSRRSGGLYGFGASAHIVLQFARHQGCEVYVFSRGEAHRQVAAQAGCGLGRETPETSTARNSMRRYFCSRRRSGSVSTGAIQERRHCRPRRHHHESCSAN